MGRPAIFFDRDGVLVRSEVRSGKPYAARRLEDFHILPCAATVAAALKEAGFLLVLVTNQPDVGNGLVERSIVEAMHDRLRDALPLDLIKVCYHAQHEGCACRKPNPGMLLEAATEMDIDLQASYIIGDRWSDVVAGAKARCYTVFVNRGYEDDLPIMPKATVNSLGKAAAVILARFRTCPN